MSKVERLDFVEMNAVQTQRQINMGALWSIGAQNFRYFTNALVFDAKIHPRKADGTRYASARKMEVKIQLTSADLYYVKVTYLKKNGYMIPDVVTHFECDDLYADNLSAVMLSLDNGDDKKWML